MTSRPSTSKQQQSPQSQLPNPSHASTAVPPSICNQCHNVQTAFFCTVCLSERIILQHADYRRLREARQRARSRVEILLGLVEIQNSSGQQQNQSLPDPFGEPEKRGGGTGHRRKYSSPITAPHHGASIQDRLARATLFKLQTDIKSDIDSTFQIQSEIVKGKRRLVERRRELDRRKYLLERVVKHVKHGGVGIDDVQELYLLSNEKVSKLESMIEVLQVEGKRVAGEVAKSRAKLAREAFAIFDVCAPSSSLANSRNSSSKSKVSAPSDRSQRSKERYSAAGAFAIDFTSAFDLGRSIRDGSKVNEKEEVVNVNDWTISGLVLPLPSDLKRFDRAEINGAIGHTIQLLQLITTYLGITLPFVISIHGNLPQIRANSLWGAGAKETLYLSSSVHTALIASTNSSSIGGGLGASMMSSLGASTLSTIESFVQLPSAKNLPWSKTTLSDLSSKVEATGQTSREAKGGIPEDTATLEGKRFCYALTMLSYDVAYLCHLQGVKIDLVLAAGSILRLLSKAIQSPDLGNRSHVTHQSLYNISNLQFTAIDFAQLLQIHEPGSRTTISLPASRGNDSKAIMEGSYVDAKKAAESILDIRHNKSTSDHIQIPIQVPATTSTSPSTAGPLPRPALPKVTTNTQSKEKVSSLAAKRVPSTLPLERAPKVSSSKASTAKQNALPSSNTLDFLRVKGQRDPKAISTTIDVKKLSTAVIERGTEERSKSKAAKASKTVQVNASIPAASGTIIFNGKEIRGKTSSSLKEYNAKPDEEGWHVL